CYAVCRNPLGVRVDHQLERRDGVVEVEQGLAHPHEHDVADDALAPGRRAQLAVGEPELPDDLGHREIAVESLPAGRAELAGKSAARLGGDAQSTPVRCGNEYRVDLIPRDDVQ